jgi:RimJ/RimL family protein N-acetyltransferase
MSQGKIPKHVPEQFESERLIIRCPRPEEDAAVLNAAVVSSLEELRPWMAWAQSPYHLEQQVESLRKAREAYLERTDFRLLLFLKETGELVGSSGIHRPNWDVRKFEIGYWVVTKHSGKGYITEAVDRITRFCIEELQANRVEIRCDALNVKSAAVAKRLGFRLEGVLRKHDLNVRGELRDTLVFSKVRGEEFS